MDQGVLSVSQFVRVYIPRTRMKLFGCRNVLKMQFCLPATRIGFCTACHHEPIAFITWRLSHMAMNMTAVCQRELEQPVKIYNCFVIL
jgi:hypothetical protein